MNCVKGTSYEMCCINDRFATCNGPIELCEQFFGVLLTVHLSIFILVINQLDAQNFCFTISFISCLYMFRTPCAIGVMIPVAV